MRLCVITVTFLHILVPLSVPIHATETNVKRLEALGDRIATAFESTRQVEAVPGLSSETSHNMDREITGKDGAPMVLVPAGAFLVGEGNDTHQVSLNGFYMDKFEVPASLYGKFLKATGHRQPRFWGEFQVAGPGQGDRPVVGIDLDAANAYCRWAGKRLPTNDEWEKAARGPDGRTYPWGNQTPSPTLANYGQSWCGLFCNVYAEKLRSVGSYGRGKSPYGIYDMAGNVLEWTEEGIVRGGSWYSSADNLRSSYRRDEPTVRHGSTGVRCAQDIPK